MRIINPLLTSCAGLCMLVALGGQVIAQDGQSELPEVTDDVELITAEEALVIDGKAYTERYGVSLEEAMRRLTIMAGTAEEIDALATSDLGVEVVLLRDVAEYDEFLGCDLAG